MDVLRRNPTPRAGRATIGAALAITLAIAVAACAAAATGPGESRAPALYWGAQIGPQITGEQPPWDMEALYKFERKTKKQASLLSFAAPFADCKGAHCSFYTFPTIPMEDLRAHGTIPFFSWSSSSSVDSTHDPRFQLKKVIRGRYDAYIREFAESAREWGHPFFLRFNWEMNGDWFPWSEGVNGNKAGDYVGAWRHVHRIFTSVGATNATWVWCPNVGGEQNLRKLYPGEKFVDWTCLDGYNWGTRFSWARWQSFDRIFHASYKRVLRITHNKPMVIGEVASTTYGGSKAAWLRDMLKTVRTRYKNVRGLIYFDVPDRGTKWPIESPHSVTNAFASGIRNGAYSPNVFGDISASPIAPPLR